MPPSPRILIVENEQLLAQELEFRLQQFGYQVSGVATSAKEAIELARLGKPDLILMDILLDGELDGIQAAMEIRRESSVPIVYLTAFADEATLKRAKLS